MSNPVIPDSGMDFRNSPAFQRRMARIAAMGPEDRAVMQTLVDQQVGAFANDEMRKHLAAIKQSNAEENAWRSLGQHTDSYNTSAELSSRALGQNEAQNALAMKIGAVNIPVQAGLGYLEKQRYDDLAKRYGLLAGLYDTTEGNAS